MTPVAGGTVAATEEEMEAEAATDSAARLRKGGGGVFSRTRQSVPILVQMFGKRNNWRPEDVLASQLAMNPKTWQGQSSEAAPRLTSKSPQRAGFSEADDGVRTRDPQLGKLMLYQLSYVRVSKRVPHPRSNRG